MNDIDSICALYQQQYSDFLIALTQIEILNTVGQEVLPDFPHNLPEDLRDKVAICGKRQLKEYSEATKSEGRWEFRYSEDTDVAERLGFLTFSLIRAIIPSRRLPDNEETNRIINGAFKRLIDAQALIMLFAYLDAFMADSLRAICQVCPQVMKSEKKIDWTWNVALDIAMTENLISHLTDRCVLDFGHLGIPERVKVLKNKPFNLEFECTEEVKVLESAEQLRHIAVHNGGRASQEYLKRTRRTDVAVGEYVPISFGSLQRTMAASQMLAYNLFESIENKYFDGG
jgi:hypothetical protein